jgi:hypothetical protein
MAMKRIHWGYAAAALAAVGLVWGLGGLSPARAQPGGAPKQASANTPDNFPYEIVNGRRVPRGKRVVNGDGSWREEIRDGACVTLKEQTPSGEYRETRKCD